MAKIDIIVPCYNASKNGYLDNCLDSVFRQTFNDFRVIAIDDASTDNTFEVLNSYNSKHNNMVVLENGINKGICHTRNKGLEISDSEYVLFLDDDDYIEKDYLQIIFNNLNKKTDVVETARIVDFFRKNKVKYLMEFKLPEQDIILPKSKIDVFSSLRYVTGTVFRRETIGNVRFDEELRCYEDCLFTHMVRPNINTYKMSSYAGYHAIFRSSSYSNTIGEHHMDYLKSASKTKQFYRSNNFLNSKIGELKIDEALVGNMIVLIFKCAKMDVDKVEKEKNISRFLNAIETECPLWVEKNKFVYTILKSNIANFIFNHHTLDFNRLFYTLLSMMNDYGKSSDHIALEVEKKLVKNI